MLFTLDTPIIDTHGIYLGHAVIMVTQIDYRSEVTASYRQPSMGELEAEHQTHTSTTLGFAAVIFISEEARLAGKQPLALRSSTGNEWFQLQSVAPLATLEEQQAACKQYLLDQVIAPMIVNAEA